MIRMEIACFLILFIVAIVYFTSERKKTMLHETFSILLIVVLFNLLFDGITVYSVHHLDSVPLFLNNLFHRFFIGSIVLVVYLFYKYIAFLVEDETGKKSQLNTIAILFLMIALLGVLLLPIHYAVTPLGNYSDGIHANVCYVATFFYLLCCCIILYKNFKYIDSKKKWVISIALSFEIIFSLLQGLHPTWLISGIGITLMTLSFYLTLENPEILRRELYEQKMSMLYLKSQINPHFLYNTLDTIRIQAQLNQDKQVADLLMHLVDFFRLSVKVDHQMVPLEDEFELVEAYMDLMCYRYPQLEWSYDIQEDVEGLYVPNFILQPIVENSLLHGLKNKGYQGKVTIQAYKMNDSTFKIEICDNGCGFDEEKKKKLEDILKNYDKKQAKLEGNSIGILNVQKRIKLLCGKEYGLYYSENEFEGVTAHLLLKVMEEDDEKA